jgi:hypothetical protein
MNDGGAIVFVVVSSLGSVKERTTYKGLVTSVLGAIEVDAESLT